MTLCRIRAESATTCAHLDGGFQAILGTLSARVTSIRGAFQNLRIEEVTQQRVVSGTSQSNNVCQARSSPQEREGI